MLVTFAQKVRMSTMTEFGIVIHATMMCVLTVWNDSTKAVFYLFTCSESIEFNSFDFRDDKRSKENSKRIKINIFSSSFSP